MLRIARNVGLLLLFSSTSIFSQTLDYTQIGIPQNSPQIPLPIGFIDPLSRQVHLEIPIAVMSTRSGVPIQGIFSYDPTFYTGNTGATKLSRAYGPGFGFSFRSHFNPQFFSDRVAHSCPSGYTGSNNTYWHFRVVDLSGVHYISGWDGTTPPSMIIEHCVSVQNPNVQINNPAETVSLPGEDGKYYFLLKAGHNDGTDGNFVWAEDGTAVLPLGAKPYDTNGNYLYSATNNAGAPFGEFTTNPVALSGNSAGFCANQTEYVYVTASDGSRQTYTVQCTTLAGPNNTTVTLMTSLVLPDGTQYTFSYDSAHDFVLSGITLPAGGQITFSYSNTHPVHAYPGLDSATFEGGTWTLTGGTTVINGVTVITSTVIAPPRYDAATNSYISDTTMYTAAPYSGGEYQQFAGQILYYSGSNTLLKTVNAQYTSPGTDSAPYNCLKSFINYSE